MTTAQPDFTPDSPWLEELLGRLPDARVAVFGDLCLDAYWEFDIRPSETSVETGLPAHRVREQRYAPGGGGNVAANLAALGVRHVTLVGLVGSDLFGDELLRQLARRGLTLDHVLRGPAGWPTRVFAKPHRDDHELNRLDFGPGEPPPPDAIAALLSNLEPIVAGCATAIINQQVPGGWPRELIAGLNAIVARHPRTLFIVDSRDHAGEFPHAALKLNLREAARLLGESDAGLMPEDALRFAAALAQRQDRPVMVTRGEHGLALAVDGRMFDLPGVDLPGAVDPVGAGDTAVAALAAAFAVGAPPLAAATFANLAAAITTRQLRTTGVATPDALRAVGPAPDYVYAPRLAAHPHLARHAPATDIEIVSGRRPAARIRHAIFDHDGTVSVLRQGWEEIMEPMMVQAILGDHAATIADATRARIVDTVRSFIDRTTGIQTLAQMKGLGDLVREFGLVEPAAVLDEHGYKAIFNSSLLAVVKRRIAQLGRGELSPDDWQVKHARTFLERLRAAGLTLYLASGTDQADAAAEARLLGYDHLFDGGIFGAVGDLRVEAKRDVLLRILRASGARAEEILVVGDGPVEIREGRRRGACTLGVASDEVRRHGLNLKKRARLIRAGADLVIPDFCQTDSLLAHLGLA